MQESAREITLRRVSRTERERMLEESHHKPGAYAAMLVKALVPEYQLIAWRGKVCYLGAPNKPALPRNLLHRVSDYLQESFLEISEEDACSIPLYIDLLFA